MNKLFFFVTIYEMWGSFKITLNDINAIMAIIPPWTISFEVESIHFHNIIITWKKNPFYVWQTVCISNVIYIIWKQEKWTIDDYIAASVTTCSRSIATIPIEIQFGGVHLKYESGYHAFTRSEASHLNHAKSEVGQLNCSDRECGFTVGFLNVLCNHKENLIN